MPKDIDSVWINGDDFSLISAVNDIFYDLMADFFRVRRGADNGNSFRFKSTIKILHGNLLLI